MLETILLSLILLIAVLSLFKKVNIEQSTDESSIVDLRVKLEGLTEQIRTIQTSQTTESSSLKHWQSELLQQQNVGVLKIDDVLGKIQTLEYRQSNLNTALTTVQSHLHERKGLEQQTSDSIKRLEGILAGSQSKGLAGENIVSHFLSELPAGWQVRDYKIGGKKVEFGLKLPNNLVLPIDSKWAATDLLDKFSNTENLDKRRLLKTEIKRCVLNKAREVKKYIEPTLTTHFGIAAVPDAIYNLCPECQIEAFEMRVVVISYSLLVPYLLMVLQSTASLSTSYDASRLHSCIRTTEDSLQSLQSELDGRFARAITMLSNAKDDMRVQISKANTGMAKLQAESPDTNSIIELNSTEEIAA